MPKPSRIEVEEAARVLREGLERAQQFSKKGDYAYASGCAQGVIENALALLTGETRRRAIDDIDDIAERARRIA